MSNVKIELANVQSGFVQGEITQFTGNEANALMESDVARISNSINTELIDPVIDFVIACDDVLEQSVTESLNNSKTALSKADVADVTAGQANSKATDALSKATTAENEAKRAHTRIDELKIPQSPNLDTQTWNWLPRSFDSVSIKVENGITLADAVGGKPHITWTPIRQNTDTTKYFLEGRFEVRFRIMLMDWIQKSPGGNIVYLGGVQSLASFNGRINPVGLSNDIMKPTSIQVNAYTAKDSQMIFGASADAYSSTSQEVKLAIFADISSDRFSQYTDPVYVDMVMTFQRDSTGNFGFGTLFPTLNPNS